MNRSSWGLDGAQSPALKVNKQEDGTFKAEYVGQTGQVVGPAVATSESNAINLAKQAYQKAVEQGKL